MTYQLHFGYFNIFFYYLVVSQSCHIHYCYDVSANHVAVYDVSKRNISYQSPRCVYHRIRVALNFDHVRAESARIVRVCPCSVNAPLRYRHSPTATTHSIRSWQWMSPRVQGVTGMGGAQCIAPAFVLLYLRIIDLVTSSCTSSAVVLVVQSPSYCSCGWCYAYSMSESVYS